MRKALLSFTIIFALITSHTYAAQDVPVNYGPEWETIKNSYQKITDQFTQQRNQILGDSRYDMDQKKTIIEQKYNEFMQESRQLAVRRGEIIKIAAERSGVKYTLGSDPAKGRGMAGDIDLGGTPAQAKKFFAELKKLGIADAFDTVKSVQSKPGYVSLKVPMDVTVNYSGRLGKVGSSAWETQIKTDAFSKETYLSVAMEQNQPGRKAVETLDHLRKARQGLKVQPYEMLKNPESLQVATKGTFKAMVTMKVTDAELISVLKKSGLDMTPDQFLNTMDQIRKGHNIAPELAGVTKDNVRNFHRALDETSRICRNKAVQSFQNEMTTARHREAFLRQSKNPAVRAQMANAKAGRIDSMARMRENLNSLIDADAKVHSPLTPKGQEVHTDNMRLQEWMKSIEKGVPQKPVGPMIFGEKAQYRLPGADKVNNLIKKGIQGYQNFRTNAKFESYAGTGMKVFGGAMIGASWYGIAKSKGASTTEATAVGVMAGIATLSRFGTLYLGYKDLENHLTVKAQKYGQDQELSYALKGMDIEDDDVKELINRRVLVRRGIYTAVKATSYSSVFYMNPTLMVAGAALESGLAVYEAYEEADLWERYAEALEEMNQAIGEHNMRRGAYMSGQIAEQLAAQAKALRGTLKSYHGLMKEKDGIARMRKEFTKSDEAFQNYAKNITKQMESLHSDADRNQAQSALTNLERIQHQSDLYVAKLNQTAAVLSQNPESAASAMSVVAELSSNYQALKMQMDLMRPLVQQNANETTAKDQPAMLSGMKSYQERLAKMEMMLNSRYETLGYLVNNSKKIQEQIVTIRKKIPEYIASMSRYESYLMKQQGAEATQALTAVTAAIAKLKAIELPSEWKTDFVDPLKEHYVQVRDLMKQVQESAKYVKSIYPEPLASYYEELTPQEGHVSDNLNQQWRLSGQALQKFHSALASLHAQVAAIVPEQEQAIAQNDGEAEVEYRDWDPTELQQELARLHALKKELAKRSEAMIADLNKAYFADRDALFKAYEAAFKEPKMLYCDNCKTETLHSMDYSESPPHVWCNVCGRILSFMEWSGKGDSLKAIRTRGQAKKAAIQEQLKTNQHAVEMAINQVQAALN